MTSAGVVLAETVCVKTPISAPWATPVTHATPVTSAQTRRSTPYPSTFPGPCSGPRRANTYCHLVAVNIAPGDPLVALLHSLLLRSRAPCALAAGEDLRNQPNQGFVHAATIKGPAGPAPNLLRTLGVPLSRRRPRPAAQPAFHLSGVATTVMPTCSTCWCPVAGGTP